MELEQLLNLPRINQSTLSSDDSNSYSFSSKRLWCHSCQSESRRLISSQQQEILCSRCNFALEIITEGQEHPSSFVIEEPPRQQQQQQQEDNQSHFNFGSRNQSENNNNSHQRRSFDDLPFTSLFEELFGGSRQRNTQQQPQNQGDHTFFFTFFANSPFSPFSEMHRGSRNKPADENKLKNLKQQVIECDEENNQCSICYDHYKKGENKTVLPCNHEFHDCCVSTWLKQNNSCPLCRKSI